MSLGIFNTKENNIFILPWNSFSFFCFFSSMSCHHTWPVLEIPVIGPRPVPWLPPITYSKPRPGLVSSPGPRPRRARDLSPLQGRNQDSTKTWSKAPELTRTELRPTENQDSTKTWSKAPDIAVIVRGWGPTRTLVGRARAGCHEIYYKREK